MNCTCTYSLGIFTLSQTHIITEMAKIWQNLNNNYQELGFSPIGVKFLPNIAPPTL
jgi:DNA-binding MltR family transcriptional regulator